MPKKEVTKKRFAALKQLLLELEERERHPLSINYVDACYIISVSKHIKNYELFLFLEEGQTTPMESLSSRLKYASEGTSVFGHKYRDGNYWLREQAGDEEPPQYQLPLEFVKERENYKKGLPPRESVGSPLKQQIRIQEEDDEKVYPEGEEKYRIHRVRERKKKLIDDAKKNRKAKDSKLHCDVCGFSFIEKYGDIGDGFIEAHHILPLSKLNTPTKNSIEDIALVSSNCHRMLHRLPSELTIADLKQRINSQSLSDK